MPTVLYEDPGNEATFAPSTGTLANLGKGETLEGR